MQRKNLLIVIIVIFIFIIGIIYSINRNNDDKKEVVGIESEEQILPTPTPTVIPSPTRIPYLDFCEEREEFFDLNKYISCLSLFNNEKSVEEKVVVIPSPTTPIMIIEENKKITPSIVISEEYDSSFYVQNIKGQNFHTHIEGNCGKEPSFNFYNNEDEEILEHYHNVLGYPNGVYILEEKLHELPKVQKHSPHGCK